MALAAGFLKGKEAVRGGGKLAREESETHVDVTDENDIPVFKLGEAGHFSCYRAGGCEEKRDGAEFVGGRS